VLDDGDAPKIAVAKRYVLPHERWLTNYWVQRLRANPRRDVAQAERKNGAESFWLDSVAFVDLELSLVIILPGLLLSVVVVGKVFHEVTAALVTGA
jgi:hypothetical protein